MTSGRPTSENEMLDSGSTDHITTDTDPPPPPPNGATGPDMAPPTGTIDDPATIDDTGSGGPEQEGRSWGRIAIVVGLVAALALGGFRLVTLTSERNDLAAEFTEVEESLRIARGDLGGQIEQLEQDNAELAEQVEQLQALFSESVNDLGVALDEVDALTEQLAERDAELEERDEQIAELSEIVELIGTELELMPDLLGTPIDEVREFAEELGLELVELEVAPGNVIARPDDVIGQLPLEETPLIPGSVIWVEVFTPPLELTDE